MMNELGLRNSVLTGATTADFSHIRIGGRARGILAPDSERALSEILRTLNENSLPYRIVGGGSNLLFPEAYAGFLVTDRRMSADIRLENGLVRASGGVNVNRLLMWLADRGLAGPDFLAGVPAHLGGAIRMNAGAFGESMADWVHEATILDPTGHKRVIPATELGFAYRGSKIEGCVLEAALETIPRDGVREQILERIDDRRRKQPLTKPNLGCIFKNPEGFSAGQLIDRCGLKGAKVGAAMVSEKHANFIVNLGGAQQSDVLRLIERIRCCVASQEDIELELEIEVIQ
jgi:UDP-N-acetylmuramate dehydrogenase